jgi:hypothetical protein
MNHEPDTERSESPAEKPAWIRPELTVVPMEEATTGAAYGGDGNYGS